jgi:hydrogenase/urease accessory protein HupE
MTMKHLAAALLMLTAPSAALAHPGHHDGFSASGLMEHLATSPFHVLLWLVAVVALAGGLFAIGRGRFASARRNDKR